MSSSLEFFTSTTNELGNLVILLREGAHVITEFSGFASAFDFDLASNRSELIDISWSNFLFNREEL